MQKMPTRQKGDIMKLIILIGLLIGFNANAVTITPNGLSINVAYEEPTMNEDTEAAPNSTPLTDLARTEVYAGVNGAPEILCGTSPASAPTGGGTVTTPCSITIARGEEKTVIIQVYAIDTHENENRSKPSLKVSTVLDLNPPAAPK